MLNALGQAEEKTDPMGFFFEKLPKNAAIVWDTTAFQWSDQPWLEQRAACNTLELPMSIYEVHLGSWRKHSHDESYSYIELADELVGYVQEMEFTHVE
ncbi:MAG: 1,4-alpha-glucan branching enzyme, partial [Verrucomicrobiota bacterium]|nr:1,4-alpha-glucan branching enzyme [Verrucomicrobiota bacterium]